MADINIEGAPAGYRKYLQMGDVHSGPKGKDGRLNTEGEAKKAADAFCQENDLRSCEEFLSYLDHEGALSKSMVRSIYADNKDKRVKDDYDKGKINALLASLDDKNEYIRRAAIKELVKLATSNTVSSEIKTKMVPSLVKLFWYMDENIQKGAESAIREFAASGHPGLQLAAVETLIRAIELGNENAKKIASGICNSTSILPELKSKLVASVVDAGDISVLLEHPNDKISPELMLKITVSIDKNIMALKNERVYTLEIAARRLTPYLRLNISPELKSKIIDALIDALMDESRQSPIASMKGLLIEIARNGSPDTKARIVDSLILKMDKDFYLKYIICDIAKLDLPSETRTKIANLFITRIGFMLDRNEKSSIEAIVACFKSDISIQYKTSIVTELMTQFDEGNSQISKTDADNAVFVLKSIVEADIAPDLRLMIVNSLIKALNGGQEKVSRRAADLLSQLAKSGSTREQQALVRPLIELLNNKSNLAIFAATLCEVLKNSNISQVDKADIVDALIKVLEDNDQLQLTAQQSLYAFAKIGPVSTDAVYVKTKMAASLIHALESNNEHVLNISSKLLAVIAQYNDPVAVRSMIDKKVDSLIKALESDNWMTKRSAINVLTVLLNANISSYLNSKIKRALELNS